MKRSIHIVLIIVCSATSLYANAQQTTQNGKTLTQEICNGLDDDGDGAIDEDCIPVIQVSDAQVVEGNSGTKQMKFSISLRQAFTDTVDFKFTTADNTATADSDYVKKQGALRFLPGQVQKTIAITILGDTAPEPHESFKLLIGQPIHAVILDNTGMGLIRNDDPVTVDIQSPGFIRAIQ